VLTDSIDNQEIVSVSKLEYHKNAAIRCIDDRRSNQVFGKTLFKK